MEANKVDVLSSPEEVLSTLTREGKRRWMYPVESAGNFLKRRKVVGWILILTYLLLPVFRVGGRPAVLLDFIHRQFAIFGLTLYPTDTILFMLFGISMILLVVLGTALLGRVWCGWACPQTVYMEFVYRPIERLIEGKEHVRKRRDDGPMNWDKAWRKGLKLSIYLLISLLLAHTFVAYFVGWSNLHLWMLQTPKDHWGFFVMMAFVSGLVMFDFTYFREQMCTITCPYARMQSVLLDEQSLIVSYDPNRGEPRAKRSKKVIQQEEAGTVPAKGDCIDCKACVRTCPTGIDIREGLQMECITCTQCIDACDVIMDRIGKPRGLIRYTSENALDGKVSNILRPRSIVYSLFLVALFSTFIILLVNRDPYDINIGRSIGAPFTELPDGRITNRLHIRVRNQTPDEKSFTITLAEPSNGTVQVVGESPISLKPGEMKRTETWIILPAADFKTDKLQARFNLEFSDGSSTERSYLLLGPAK